MEKQRWSTEQWDERLRLRMLELEQQLPDTAMDPAAWPAMEAKLAAAQNGAAKEEAGSKRRFLPWWGSAKAAPGVAAPRVDAPGVVTPGAHTVRMQRAVRLAAAITGLLLLAGLGWGLYEQLEPGELVQKVC
ncbi:hypothetical protein [Cesiribacter andamanensis]|uniref:Uncharacterized protein n=1 Tax=Cesiribacter andamanensis AMV16 TaxID=1279009 RepID=M7NJD9_9BACT|nr:hypothetical protein [Cesiribacter andamanensis]EMR01900.1 hypothetical protein ADICEAN_02969 [Cesiribacter andamanensis AMV16]